MVDDEADVALWNKEIARYFQGSAYRQCSLWVLTLRFQAKRS